jgi:hypothetical protein
MRVPRVDVLVADAPGEDLHEPHTAFDEPAGHEALPSVRLRHLVVEPEQLLRSFRFTSCNVGRPNILSPRLFLIHASDEARAMILHLLYTVFTRFPL